ncbi:MAG TPA: hypothetical protein VNI20_13150 [Fimbriimonadaceae bacterium]|nr:hypothetical protein [Fimbriimonadaceae bacterium]
MKKRWRLWALSAAAAVLVLSSVVLLRQGRYPFLNGATLLHTRMDSVTINLEAAPGGFKSIAPYRRDEVVEDYAVRGSNTALLAAVKNSLTPDDGWVMTDVMKDLHYYYWHNKEQDVYITLIPQTGKGGKDIGEPMVIVNRPQALYDKAKSWFDQKFRGAPPPEHFP